MRLEQELHALLTARLAGGAVVVAHHMALVAHDAAHLEPHSPRQVGEWSGLGDGTGATIGAEMLLQGVAMNPGRSIAVARHRHTLFFGLPGSPWAAFIGFEVFIRPALRAMLGQPSPPPIAAVLTTTVQVRRGVTHFLPARLRQSADGWEATPLSDLLSIAQLESHPIGLIPVLPHRRQLSRGARVRVHLL